MATVDAVKRALRALATRTDTARPPCLAVLEEAEASLVDVDRAAGFVDAVGLDGLERAIENAGEAGFPDAAERGRGALETLHEYRAAATNVESESAAATSVEPQNGSATGRTNGYEDHFQSVHGTHKRGAGQDSGE